MQVKLKWNVARSAGFLFLAVFVALGSGCGGLGASGSVSPATFLLPGIGQAEPQSIPSETDQPIHSPSEETTVVALTSVPIR